MTLISPQQRSHEAFDEAAATELIATVLNVMPLRAIRQRLGKSGNATFKVDLPGGQAVALRTSTRPRMFAFTPPNLAALRLLDLPVQSVLARGATSFGGSYIVLNWIPGTDLVNELADLSQPQMTTLAGQWVEIQRRLGRLPESTGFGWAPIGRNAPLKQWTEVFGSTEPVAAPDDLSTVGQLRTRLRKLRIQIEPYFLAMRPACFLDDLTLKNILVSDGALTGIIDVDFVCYGDPLLALGATLCAIVSEIGDKGDFYGRELIRCWNPNSAAQRALWFYAALWATGTLGLIDAEVEERRAAALATAADGWLDLAQ